MATDHRGNPINNNNPAKTNKDRMMTGTNIYGEPDDDGLGPEGDTRSDKLSARHQKEDVPLISDREDHSALLPSQQTGNRYEY